MKWESYFGGPGITRSQSVKSLFRANTNVTPRNSSVVLPASRSDDSAIDRQGLANSVYASD